jgi:hypothetical protein
VLCGLRLLDAAFADLGFVLRAPVPVADGCSQRAGAGPVVRRRRSSSGQRGVTSA